AVHDPAAASRLGLALWAAGEQDAAAPLLQAAVAGNPQDAVAMAALAALVAQTAEGDGLDEALLLATQATQLASDDFRTWAALADVHRARRDFGQAGFYYGFALRLQPESPTVLKDAGACWLLARQPQQALPLIERALVAAPQDAENYGNLAFARAQLGEAAAALEAARQATTLSPADVRLRILHGDLAHRAGAREEALEAWARAAEIEPGMTISPQGGNIALGPGDEE
ncbi:MAG: tetratricopeptide repeat protein, partial [Terriglobales bacterium]